MIFKGQDTHTKTRALVYCATGCRAPEGQPGSQELRVVARSLHRTIHPVRTVPPLLQPLARFNKVGGGERYTSCPRSLRSLFCHRNREKDWDAPHKVAHGFLVRSSNARWKPVRFGMSSNGGLGLRAAFFIQLGLRGHMDHARTRSGLSKARKNRGLPPG
jgi:hypothetical protein